MTAAYAIRYLPKISVAVWGKLLGAARREPEAAGTADIVRASLVSAAFVHALVESQKTTFKAEVVKYARAGSADAKIEACAALAMQGQDEDVPLLVSLLDDGNTDVRVAAANAILQIDRRHLKSALRN
jgi:HEAT repeat protein